MAFPSFQTVPAARGEWRARWLLLPRVGMRVTAYCTTQRLLMPGRYLARWSPSLRQWLYRRAPR
ncbi:MAG: hypothetical protein U0S50_14830 [Sphingopyxis sp.]|uniref:hypothetical protein n=1 Tax=Sphingopyxis sp. TaxID=1908224 RepID=UPI002ABD0954|nr:hypothetical protein [Sphingopyxis sp.]MDZ3833072.1 hypothetical protein [Sphingopyxis sp.]